MHLHLGQLVVSESEREHSASVLTGTLIHDVVTKINLEQTSFVLVVDHDRQILGLVSSQQILSRVQNESEIENRRWNQMAIDSLLSTTLRIQSERDPSEPPAKSIDFDQPVDCLPILEQQEMVGMLVQDELYVSWKRVEAVLDHAACDAVTALPNRMMFERRFEEEWNRALRLNNSIALLIVDVDYFKEVNDLCGHAIGDAVLHMVGSCIRRNFRSYDLVARYGGDEFVAICGGCRPGEISIPVERLQKGIEQLSVPAGNGQHRITLSIGAAVMHGDLTGVSSRTLIEAADQCLYKAKETGRNCGYCWDFTRETRKEEKMFRVGHSEPVQCVTEIFS